MIYPYFLHIILCDFQFAFFLSAKISFFFCNLLLNIEVIPIKIMSIYMGKINNLNTF